MPQNLLGAASAVVLSITAFAISTSAATPEVALTFHDVELSITGQLIRYIDQVYIIQTNEGLLHVPAVLVDCIGKDCEGLTL